MRTALFLYAAVLAALWRPSPAAAITGDEIIERVRERFSKARTYEARFEKRFYWAVLDKELSRQGRIWTHRPGRFRVQLEDGDLVVADGEAIWAYSKANEQVIVSAYDGVVLQTPWEVLVKYADSYRPVAVERIDLDGREVYLLTLQPMEDVPPGMRMERMRLWVQEKDWRLLRIEQVESEDNISTYILSGHRRNKGLDEDLFRFTPPEGTEIIDRRPPPPADP